MNILPTIQTKYLKSDIIAGITDALVLIPQSLAYAQLAGLPPRFGLYAALIPPVLASVFGSSRHLSTGPVAVLSLMTAASLTPLVTAGSDEYITAALLLAFGLGLMQLTLGLVKLGGLVTFLSHPVIYGFTNAAAIIIATTQLPKFFAVSPGSFEHQYEMLIAVSQKALIHTDLMTLLLGVWTLLCMITIRSINKKLPAILLTIFFATILSLLTRYKGAVIGIVPTGLPSFHLVPLQLDMMVKLFPAIVTMGLIGFTESISVAQALAVKTKERVNPNRELIGQGLANLVGSLFQSYPVSGSFTRTAVKFQAGAKTSFSSFVASTVVVLTLLFFTGFLYYIPQVVLAAIIVISVSGLIDFKKIKHIWYTSHYDGIAAMLTFVGTLYFAPDLEKGVGLGVVFSVGHYLYRNVHPRVVFLSKYKDGGLHDVGRFKLDRCENIAVIRLDAPLFFANASFFENEIINDTVKNKNIKDVLIVASGINEIDSTGEEMLQALCSSLKAANKNLYFSDVKLQVLDILKRTGLFDEIGKKHFFLKAEEGVHFLTNQLDHAQQHTDMEDCPLRKYVKYRNGEKVLLKDKRETIAYFYNKLHLSSQKLFKENAASHP